MAGVMNRQQACLPVALAEGEGRWQQVLLQHDVGVGQPAAELLGPVRCASLTTHRSHASL